jgi:hypothetical protein
VVLEPLVLALRGSEVPDETGPVHDVTFEDLNPAVVALHEVQSGQ